MQTFRFLVSLRIWSQTFTPAEISNQLGLEPEWKHAKGQPRMTPKGRALPGLYDESYWSFKLAKQDGEELFETIDRHSANLLQHQQFFQRIREAGGRVEFLIAWFTTANTGAVLDVSLMQRLVTLNVDLGFDVYTEDKIAD